MILRKIVKHSTLVHTSIQNKSTWLGTPWQEFLTLFCIEIPRLMKMKLFAKYQTNYSNFSQAERGKCCLSSFLTSLSFWGKSLSLLKLQCLKCTLLVQFKSGKLANNKHLEKCSFSLFWHKPFEHFPWKRSLQKL